MLKKLRIINLFKILDYEKILINLKIRVKKQTTGWFAWYKKFEAVISSLLALSWVLTLTLTSGPSFAATELCFPAFCPWLIWILKSSYLIW